MALKDWKKVNTNNWFYLKENKAVIVKTETIYFPEIKEIYVFIMYDKSTGKTNYRKQFKTKTPALKYAKAYMSKH